MPASPPTGGGSVTTGCKHGRVQSRFRSSGNRARRRARARSVRLRRRKESPISRQLFFHHSDREISRNLEDKQEHEHDFSTGGHSLLGPSVGQRYPLSRFKRFDGSPGQLQGPPASPRMYRRLIAAFECL